MEERTNSKIEIIDKNSSNLRYFHDAKKYILKKENCYEICREEVGDKFVEESLEQCDFLLLNIFSRRIIGFSTVLYTEDGKGLYISLICNAKPDTFMNIFNSQRGDPKSGKDMISTVITIARTEGLKYVKLRALNTVISYYHYLGFTFEIGSNRTAPRRSGEIQALRKSFQDIKKVQDIISEKTEKKEDITKEKDKLEHLEINAYELLKPITLHGSEGALNEKKLSKNAKFEGVDDKKPKVDIEDVFYNGISMIYKLPPCSSTSSSSTSSSRRRSRSSSRSSSSIISSIMESCNIMGGTRRKVRRRRRRTMKK